MHLVGSKTAWASLDSCCIALRHSPAPRGASQKPDFLLACPKCSLQASLLDYILCIIAEGRWNWPSLCKTGTGSGSRKAREAILKFCTPYICPASQTTAALNTAPLPARGGPVAVSCSVSFSYLAVFGGKWNGENVMEARQA